MRVLILACALSALAFGQTAQYPAAIATYDNLKVARNGVETALAYRAAAGDTLLTVRDASKIVPNMLLTIDREIVSVTAVNGNVLTVVRGFDGTTAAAHSNGAKVGSYPVAWDKNVLAAELRAVQEALGPNLANVPMAGLENPIPTNKGGTGADLSAATGVLKAAGASLAVVSGSASDCVKVDGSSGSCADEISPSRYDFSPQTPGADLTAAIVNVVTLTPCPQGVAGTNPGHYLYISGGAGAAESVLITGGTCASGAATGTIIFTPANNHTGAWTIASATNGIQEAIGVMQSKGKLSVPDGTHKMYAEATISDSLTFSCASAATSLQAQTQAQNILVVRTTSMLQRVRIENCAFTSAVVKTAGDAIEINGSGGMSNYGTVIDNVSIQAQYNGIHFASASHWSVTDPLILATTNYGIHIQNTIAPDSGDSSIRGGVIDNSVGSGKAIFYESGGGLKISDIKILNHAVAIDLQVPDGVATSDLNIVNSSIENFVTAGIRLNRAGATGSFLSPNITGNQMACASGVGIGTNAGIVGLVITGNNISCAGGTAISIGNDRATITGNHITANPGTGIKTVAGGSNVLISGNQLYNVATPYSFAVAPKLVDGYLSFAFAALPATVAPGSQVFCETCTTAAVCAAGGTGHLAVYDGSAWTCQ